MGDTRLFTKEGAPSGDRQATWNERLNKSLPTISVNHYQELKHSIHRKLLDKLDLESIASLTKPVLSNEIRKIVESLLVEETTPLSLLEREKLVNEVLDEVLGLGPLEPLLKDPSISDILVNTHKRVYIERKGKLEVTDVVFKDDAHLMQIIDRIVSAVGRRVDESSPMVDARLPDGSRVNAIIPPLSLDGPVSPYGVLARTPLTADDLLNNNTLTPADVGIAQGDGQGTTECADLRRNRLRQDHLAKLFFPVISLKTSASSRLKTRRNCSFTRTTWSAWRRVRLISKAKGPFDSDN